MDADPRRREPAGDFSLEPLVPCDPCRFQGQPIPTREWLWEGWIPKRAVTALYGDGGTGKSLLAQQFMTAIATGRSFLGFPVPRMKVLGVFCEDDDDELQRRQASINAALDVDFADLENMRWISRVGADNLLMTFLPDGRGEPTPFFWQLLDLAKGEGVQLVVIDTAADTFGGNENIRPQVRMFINLLTRLAHEIDGAVILLAHPSASGKASGSGDGGSTAWSNSVRSRLYIKRPESVGGDDPDPNLRILSRLKANYAATGVDLSVRWEDGAFVNTVDPAMAGEAEDGSIVAHRMREAEAWFIEGMNELAEKKLRCNIHRGQANYAPKFLREKTLVCATLSEFELTGAMNRLIKANRIRVEEDGPPSRRRSYLVLVSPDLPGF